MPETENVGLTDWLRIDNSELVVGFSYQCPPAALPMPKQEIEGALRHVSQLSLQAAELVLTARTDDERERAIEAIDAVHRLLCNHWEARMLKKEGG